MGNGVDFKAMAIDLRSQLEACEASRADLLWALYQVVTNEEQKRFEYWLDRVRPSGDCDSVHAKWVVSGDYADFCYGWKLQLDAIARAEVNHESI